MDEFQVLQRAVLFWNDDDPGAMRKAGQGACRLLQRLREALAARHTQALDAAAFVLGETADLEQAMDEETQSRFGRQAAGRGVRRIEEPCLLEIGHDVADRRRRQVLSEA